MKTVTLLVKQLLISATRIIRNTLYFPYAVALIFYLFFIFISGATLFLSNDAGINFINNIIKFIFSLNLFDPNGTYNSISTAEDTEKMILYCISIFAIAYEFLTRIILLFKKDFNFKSFQKNILKIFYGSTFIISSIIFIFIFKEFTFFIVFFILLLINLATLFFAYKITNIFSRMTKAFDDPGTQKVNNLA